MIKKIMLLLSICATSHTMQETTADDEVIESKANNEATESNRSITVSTPLPLFNIPHYNNCSYTTHQEPGSQERLNTRQQSHKEWLIKQYAKCVIPNLPKKKSKEVFEG